MLPAQLPEIAMGSLFAGPPKPPKLPNAPPPPPKLPDSGVQQAGDEMRARAAAAGGIGSTIFTSPQGTKTPANTSGLKTLLGS
jgi:hypothetical protein